MNKPMYPGHFSQSLAVRGFLQIAAKYPISCDGYGLEDLSLYVKAQTLISTSNTKSVTRQPVVSIVY